MALLSRFFNWSGGELPTDLMEQIISSQVIFDLDGTIHVDFVPRSEICELARMIPEPSRAFLSNSDRYGSCEVVSRLEEWGIQAAQESCLTVLDLVIETCESKDPRSGDFALAGFDSEVVARFGLSPFVRGLDTLTERCHLLVGRSDSEEAIFDSIEMANERGCKITLTNLDQTVFRNGKAVSGLGKIARSTSVDMNKITILGKPSSAGFERLGFDPERPIWVVGDRPESDGELAKTIGASFLMIR